MNVRWTTLSTLLAGTCLSTLCVAGEARPNLEAQLIREGIAALAKDVLTEGDPQRGAVLFHQRTAACHHCHAAGNDQTSLGPDLAQPNPKMTAAYVIESLLSPSKVINPLYQAVQVITDDGRVLTGILQEDTPAAVKLLLPLETGKVIVIPRKEIDEINPARISLMPVGQVNQLANRGEFLDLARYVLEIATHGAEKARELRPSDAHLQLAAEVPIDHKATIAKLDELDLETGRKLYTQNCVSCHGADGNKTLNPLARRFAKDPLKFGTDPYSMWKTISYGSGLMFPQAAILTPTERYQIVNYIREQFVREANPTQYFRPTQSYLEGVDALAVADAEKFGPAKSEVATGMIDGQQGRQMEYGPYLSHSIAFETPANSDQARFENTTERALVIRLPGDHFVCYDAERGSISGIWQGTIANTAKTHHTSYKGSSCLTPGGPLLYADIDATGWSTTAPDSQVDNSCYSFGGHYLHSGQVLLQHEIGGRRIDELPGVMHGESPIFTRTLRISSGEKDVFCLVGRVADSTVRVDGRTAEIVGKDASLAIAVGGMGEGVSLAADAKGGLWLKAPAAREPQVFTVLCEYLKAGPTEKNGFVRLNEIVVREPDFEALMAGGPRQWSKPVRTGGVLGEPIEGYAADEITIPFANPWGSWMRTTAIDFFSDGAAAVSTLSGDVWVVQWNDPQLSDVTWSRFATGLYEPLGLKIVDDVVYVRGRDRITRLHDLNSDGEADFYESFHQEGEIGANYHAFLFDLQTDRDGNFYFAKSGRKSPHEGAVVRLDPHGKTSEIVCHDFRHPNGLGAGGPHDWITVSDNPHGKAVYNGIAIVRPDAYYGYEKARTVPMLAVLPPSVDSSSGGQCWADGKRWGPLSGQMIHTSYSRLAMFYILTQDLAPHPNGFAVRMPFTFKSGVMRARVNPIDGQVYVVGQKGWDTQAPADGCLYRIRRVDLPTYLVTSAVATPKGIQLTFSCDIDAKSVNALNVEVVREEEKAIKPIAMTGATLIDQRIVEIVLPDIDKEVVALRTKLDKKSQRAEVTVLWPIRITLKLKAADGADISQVVYATINSLPEN